MTAAAAAALVPATAAADPTFGVMNASGGIYWRSAPDWNTAEAVAGNGFYPNTTIAVHCYQSGAGNVPGSADTMWEQASVVGGSGTGSGWINEHFINDGAAINQPSPGVPPCITPPSPPAAAPPLGNLVFTVYNADGGIYYRNSPSQGDTSQTPGVGVYNGDQVQLICGQAGGPGPNGNVEWSYVSNLSRPSIGRGWVNEHFINDGAAFNALPAGEQTPCPASVPGAGGGSSSTGTGGSPAPKSAFFWPTLSPKDRPMGVPFRQVADKDYDSPDWIGGHCSTAKVQALNIPTSINTLAGWSLSRLAPIYFLEHATSAQLKQIHTIILFDPGSASEMEGSGCDHQVMPTSINQLLFKWLSIPGTELLVLTSVATETNHYQGLWKYYFHSLWSQSWAIRQRAQVCDYHGQPHPWTLQKFYPIVRLAGDGLRTSGCPVVPGVTPTPWNP